MRKAKTSAIVLSFALLSLLAFSSCASLAGYTGNSVVSLFSQTNFNFPYDESKLKHATPQYNSEFMKAVASHKAILIQNELHRSHIEAMTRFLVMNKDITSLEIALNQERKSLSLLPAGMPALHYVYYYLGKELLKMGLADDSKVESFLQEWKRQYPQSISPTILLSRFYQLKGMELRGTNYAANTPAEQMEKCVEYANKSLQVLAEAPNFSVDDPYFYMTGMTAGKYSDSPMQSLQEYFMRGIEKYPDFIPIYLRLSNSLRLRWYGNTNDLKQFSYWAMSNPNAHEDPFIRYASITENMAGTNGLSVQEFLGYQFNWQDIQEGMIRITKHHQLSTARLRYYCWMAVAYQDKKTAKMLYTLLGDDYDKSMPDEDWSGTQDLIKARAWAFSAG